MMLSHDYDCLRGLVSGRLLHMMEIEGIKVRTNQEHRSYQFIIRDHGYQIVKEVDDYQMRGRRLGDLDEMLESLFRSMREEIRSRGTAMEYQERCIDQYRMDMNIQFNPRYMSDVTEKGFDQDHVHFDIAKAVKKKILTAREMLQSRVDSWLKGVKV